MTRLHSYEFTIHPSTAERANAEARDRAREYWGDTEFEIVQMTSRVAAMSIDGTVVDIECEVLTVGKR